MPFPEKLSVTITLEVTVNTQEERDYYLKPGTTEPNISFLADVADGVMIFDTESVETINGLNADQITSALQAVDTSK